jgi:hypothetical protein
MAGRRRRKKSFHQTLFSQKFSQDRERQVKGLLVAARPGPMGRATREERNEVSLLTLNLRIACIPTANG